MLCLNTQTPIQTAIQARIKRLVCYAEGVIDRRFLLTKQAATHSIGRKTMDTRFLHRLVRLLEPKRGLPDLDTSTITANHTHLGYERFVIVLLALLILGVASMSVHAYAAVPPTAE